MINLYNVSQVNSSKLHVPEPSRKSINIKVN